jgi:uncharacterized protein (UPF0261 family)
LAEEIEEFESLVVDLVGWNPMPRALQGRPAHGHNSLLTSVVQTAEERCAFARLVCEKLSAATAPVTFLLPNRRGNEWDREGNPLHDAEGLEAVCKTMRKACPPNMRLMELDAHINAPAFNEAALQVFDGWLADGTVRR